MKRYFIAAVVVALLASAGVAVAATTNVTVNATVNASCVFRTVPTVVFPDLDPTTGGAVDSPSVDLKFNCTKGVPYTLSDENNVGAPDGTYSGNLSNGPGDTIAYTLTYTVPSGSGGGNGVGNAITSEITGHIVAGAYDTAPAGLYTDTVTFTISP